MNQHANSAVVDTKECFVQFNRDHKKVMKLLSKNWPKRKKSKVVYETDSSNEDLT